MPLSTAHPGRPMGAGFRTFFLAGDSAFFLQQLLCFSRDPAGVPIPETQEGLFSEAPPLCFFCFPARNQGFVQVQGDPHSADFVNQNCQTALQTSR